MENYQDMVDASYSARSEIINQISSGYDNMLQSDQFQSADFETQKQMLTSFKELAQMYADESTGQDGSESSKRLTLTKNDGNEKGYSR